MCFIDQFAVLFWQNVYRQYDVLHFLDRKHSKFHPHSAKKDDNLHIAPRFSHWSSFDILHRISIIKVRNEQQNRVIVRDHYSIHLSMYISFIFPLVVLSRNIHSDLICIGKPEQVSELVFFSHFSEVDINEVNQDVTHAIPYLSLF